MVCRKLICKSYFLQIHDLMILGIVDSSGMKIKMISELRQFDAAIMELGLEYSDKMAIPQGLTAFPLSGYCIADCTNVVSKELTYIPTNWSPICLFTKGTPQGRHYNIRFSVTHSPSWSSHID